MKGSPAAAAAQPQRSAGRHVTTSCRRRSCTIHPLAAGEPCDPRRHPHCTRAPQPAPICTPVPHSAAVSSCPDDHTHPELLVFEISPASRTCCLPRLAALVPSLSIPLPFHPLCTSAHPSPHCFHSCRPVLFYSRVFSRRALYTQAHWLPSHAPGPPPLRRCIFLAPPPPCSLPLMRPLYTAPARLPPASQPL